MQVRRLPTSQVFTVASAATVKRRARSGLNATSLIRLVCPLRIRAGPPLVTSQTVVIGSSREARASRLLSGLKTACSNQPVTSSTLYRSRRLAIS